MSLKQLTDMVEKIIYPEGREKQMDRWSDTRWKYGPYIVKLDNWDNSDGDAHRYGLYTIDGRCVNVEFVMWESGTRIDPGAYDHRFDIRWSKYNKNSLLGLCEDIYVQDCEMRQMDVANAANNASTSLREQYDGWYKTLLNHPLPWTEESHPLPQKS